MLLRLLPVVALPGVTVARPQRGSAADLERTCMRQSHTVTLPGINIQAPWAEACVRAQGDRDALLPMPRKWVGQPLAIIETPGKARHFQRRIAGLVIFAPSWCYADKAAFARDRARHLVDPDDRLFGWREDGKPKWAWPVAWIEVYQQPLPPAFVPAYAMRAPWRFSDHRRLC